MTVQISAIGRTRLAVEGAFCVDETGTAANFIDLPIVESSGTFVPLQEHIEPAVQQQFVHAYESSKMVLGKKSSTLALTTYLAGTGAPMDGNDTWLTGTTWPIHRLLSTIMGGVSQGTPQAAVTLTTAGSTTGSLNVTSGHGTGMGAPGRAYALLLASGIYEAREIKSCTSTTLVPKVAHSEAPAAGQAILWGTCFHMIENTSGILPTLQFIVEGAEAGDEYAGLGMQGTISIDASPGAIAKISCSLTGGSWVRTSAFSLAASTITGMSPVVNVSSELVLGTGSLSSATSQAMHRVSHGGSTWTPGFANAPIMSPEGPASSGMIGWKRSRGRAVTGQIQVYDDTAINWITEDLAKTDLSLYQQIGMDGVSMVLLSAPTIQISSVPTRTPISDLYGMTVGWAGRNDAGISAAASDLARSAFRIHLF